MTFLNIAMIGGILALNIPIIIHLLNRNRPRIVKWGAMHLLEQVLRTNRRALKLEQLLLLLVRAMIPVLLAICMASPVLTGCRNLSGGSRSSVVVVLDNSYSMSAGGANSSHASATAAATQILANLQDGSDVSVVTMAGGVAPLLDEPTVRAALLIDELKKRTASYGQADVPAALGAATQILSGMAQPGREIIVISDFQGISWSKEQTQSLARLTGSTKESGLEPSLTFINVGKEANDNVAIMEVSLSKLIVGVGERVAIRANLKNFGGKAYPSLRVYLDIDGQRRSAAELSLGPGEDGQILFTHTFDEAGSRVVRLFADGDATLKEDNEFLTAIQVLDRIPVLLIDGAPAPAGEPLKSETGFLATALQPFKEGKVELADLLEARVITAAAFTPESIDQDKAIVLANVEQLTDEQVRTLEGFVRGGGGIVIFPGNRVNGDWFNASLHRQGAGLAPARLTELRGSISDATKHSRIASQSYTHPALTMFNDRRNGNLAAGEVWSWFKLQSNDDGTATSVLARLEGGDPLLIEKRYGEGTVLLACTACDADWGNLPARPFYLPMMQQLVFYAASRVEPSRNVQVGQPLLAMLPRTMIASRATLTDPSGRRHSLTVGDRGSRGLIEYRSTGQLGLHTLDVPGSDQSSLHFVVQSPRQESDLRMLPREEIDTLAARLGAEVVSSAEEYQELDRSRRHGSEIWHWFFWAVLGMCFVELFLQYRFSGARSQIR